MEGVKGTVNQSRDIIMDKTFHQFQDCNSVIIRVTSLTDFNRKSFQLLSLKNLQNLEKNFDLISGKI